MTAGADSVDTSLSLLHVLFGECDTSFNTNGGVVVWIGLVLYTFYLIAKLCDGHLLRALELIVEKLKISEDVAGATFLAMAGSAPELFHSILATFVLVSAGGVGNIIGSAVFNLLVIIGVTPLFAGKTLEIWWFPTIRDACWYMIAIVELYASLADGLVCWYEALAMVLTYVAYIVSMAYNPAIIAKLGLVDPNAEANEKELEAPKLVIGVYEPEGLVTDAAHAGKAKGSGAFGSGSWPASGALGSGRLQVGKDANEAGAKAAGALLNVVNASGDLVKTLGGSGQIAEEDEGRTYDPFLLLINKTAPQNEKYYLLLFAMICGWLMVFTYIMVDASERIGCIVGIPQVVMGLVVLAAGTSVPDAIGSIVVARQGKGDMAVANAVGSNTFDILLGLGAPWLLRTLIDGEPIEVPTKKLQETILTLAVCLVGYVALVWKSGWKLSKWTGFGMLGVYALIITWVLLREYVLTFESF